jgi:uncharacterized protein (DUF1015 family)
MEPDRIKQIEVEFAALPALWIADGHHRSAAAARVWQGRGGAADPSAWFLAVAFPDHQANILPYHRVLKDLNGLNAAGVADRLGTVGTVTTNGLAAPRQAHDVAFYLEGRWNGLRFGADLLNSPDPVERLDVSLLQKHVLGPVFGIDDPRTSQRIGFVGGGRGTGELERLVNRGEYACAFSLYPTCVAELLEVAGAGQMMPPKSTWFEPKLRDGLFIHGL